MEYELFISHASPYSSKIMALMGYAGIPHRIRVQNVVTRFAVLRKLTGKTMVPVLRRGDWAICDSTTIARYVMERSARPTLPQGAAELLAWFIEDFADEWMVRWMIHSRWRHREDAERVSEIIGRELTGGLPLGSRQIGRQVSRLLRRQMKRGGMRRENDRALQESAARVLQALEAVLVDDPPYLFGGYPTVADFSVYGQLVQYHRDPTGREHLLGYPSIRAYLRRMEAMAERPVSLEIVDSPPRDIVELQPLFAEILGAYWPVLVANYRALQGGSSSGETAAELIDGSHFSFEPSNYMQARLEALLSLVDRRYRRGDHLFGEAGLRMERALVGRITELCESEAGRRLLREYTHVGLH